MEKKELICIGCPLGCNLTATMEGNQVVAVEGNTCPRGADYARKELTNPRRIVTSMVPIRNGELPVISVKTAADIPKSMVWECMKELGHVELEAPVQMGTVVISNVCGSGVDVIATRTVMKKQEES